MILLFLNSFSKNFVEGFHVTSSSLDHGDRKMNNLGTLIGEDRVINRLEYNVDNEGIQYLEDTMETQAVHTTLLEEQRRLLGEMMLIWILNFILTRWSVCMEWGNSRQRGEHAKRHRSEKWQSDAALDPYLKGRWNKWGGWRLSNFQWYIKERATGVVCPRCRQKGGALSVGYLKAIMIKLPTILNNNKTHSSLSRWPPHWMHRCVFFLKIWGKEVT